jgi:hypothetical protein
VFVSLPLHNKILTQSCLQEERLILAQGLEPSHPYTFGLSAFEPVVRQDIMAGVHGTGMTHSWQPEVQERERGRGWGPHVPSKATPPVTSLPPTKPHLLKAPSPTSNATLVTKPHIGLWRTSIQTLARHKAFMIKQL